MTKCLLKDLIDRDYGTRFLVSPLGWPANYEQRLDDPLGPMEDEYGWRANDLDDTTVPTDAVVEARNVGRNNRW